MEDAEKISTPYSMNMNENIQVALFEPVKEKWYCFSFDAIGIPNDYAKARTGKSDGIYFYLIIFINRYVLSKDTLQTFTAFDIHFGTTNF